MDENEMQVLEDLARGFASRATRLRRKAEKTIIEAESLELCSIDVGQAIEKLKDGMAKDEQKIINHMIADIEIRRD